jgi:hypothetical protein
MPEAAPVTTAVFPCSSIDNITSWRADSLFLKSVGHLPDAIHHFMKIRSKGNIRHSVEYDRDFIHSILYSLAIIPVPAKKMCSLSKPFIIETPSYMTDQFDPAICIGTGLGRRSKGLPKSK